MYLRGVPDWLLVLIILLGVLVGWLLWMWLVVGLPYIGALKVG